jgi:hypothetical protein
MSGVRSAVSTLDALPLQHVRRGKVREVYAVATISSRSASTA